MSPALIFSLANARERGMEVSILGWGAKPALRPKTQQGMDRSLGLRTSPAELGAPITVERHFLWQCENGVHRRLEGKTPLWGEDMGGCEP